MVYATQDPGAEPIEEQAVVRPTVMSSTDEWLARISDQLQVFVDAINDAQSDDEDDSDDDPAKDAGADDKGDKPAEKKTTAKRAEVKGD